MITGPDSLKISLKPGQEVIVLPTTSGA